MGILDLIRGRRGQPETSTKPFEDVARGNLEETLSLLIRC